MLPDTLSKCKIDVLLMGVYNRGMCGRWATPYTRENIERRYRINASFFKPSYNIAPGSKELVVVRDETKKGELMKWGLIPFWAKDPKIGYRMINARAETILEKPSFRKPFAAGRCLIPAGGFYEWRSDGKRKIPYYIRLKNSPIFSFAGLYDTWTDPQGNPVKTFTIITTAPNSFMSPIHDRMPVILKEESEDMWLTGGSQAVLMNLLKPYDNEANMEAYPVSTRVNDPTFNERNLLEPI